METFLANDLGIAGKKASLVVKDANSIVSFSLFACDAKSLASRPRVGIETSSSFFMPARASRR
jgi:hypothetical protein